VLLGWWLGVPPRGSIRCPSVLLSFFPLSSLFLPCFLSLPRYARIYYRRVAMYSVSAMGYNNILCFLPLQGIFTTCILPSIQENYHAFFSPLQGGGLCPPLHDEARKVVLLGSATSPGHGCGCPSVKP